MSYFEFIPYQKYPDHYDICKNTGILKYKTAKIRDYGDSYFMEEYQNQYKKTYYEDEPNLRKMAVRRLDVIRKIFHGNVQGKILLEIGSAAGFFLDEAKKNGFSVKGYELSAREVAYSVSRLGLDVSSESVVNVPISSFEHSVDVLCAFFVIEHIQEIDTLWSKIDHWLRPGGLLYFAIPSFFGPTFRTNPELWLETHPTDHFYDYDLASMKKLLSKVGYTLKYARPMSYYPKRDLGLKGKLPLLAYKLYSNLTCYGDTIEVVFQKNEL